MKRKSIILPLVLICLVVAITAVYQIAHHKEGRDFENWAIGIYAGKTPFDLAPAANVHNPVLASEGIRPKIKAAFLADPFMVRDNGVWYLFFELLNVSQRVKKGEIGLATSPDGVKWEFEQIVLAEPFHLSYPYVFKWGNSYYMIPESARTNQVRLYKARAFPTRWDFVKAILQGKLTDPSIFRYEDKWWLMAGEEPGKLRLFYAAQLEGPWTEHPKSPVIKNDPHNARPGGRVLVRDGRIYRFTQDDAPFYGMQVWAFEITKLTTADYEERPVKDTPVVKPAATGWNSARMHTVDAHELEDGSWLAVVDGNSGLHYVHY